MAWNEPGGNGKDPWGGNRGNDGPPDLDEAIKNLQKKLSGIFGGKSTGGGRGSGSGGLNSTLIIAILAVVAVLWVFMGTYQVDAKENVIVLRFGVYHETVGEGLHWNPYLIDRTYRVEVTTEQQYSTRGLMLTEDQNIVELPIKVQYRAADAKSYVLNVKDPTESLRHATDSSLRHVVGSTSLNQVLSEGREKIGVDVKARLQNYLNMYGTGIHIIGVNIQEGRPPQQVKSAFDDVIKAKEDEERFINEAQSYANEIIPVARGAAQRTIEEANAYREEVVARASGDAARFEKLMTEYQKAPEVTRERLYLESIQEVMQNTSKVMVDVEGGNNLLYLPLDKLTTTTNRRSGSSALSSSQLDDLSNAIVDRLRREMNSGARSSSREGR